MTVDFATKQDIEKLDKKFDQVNDLLQMILSGMKVSTVVCVEGLASIEGLSSKTIRKKPWYMPNFGEGTRRWDWKQVQAWREIPLGRREEMYRQHLLGKAEEEYRADRR